MRALLPALCLGGLGRPERVWEALGGPGRCWEAGRSWEARRAFQNGQIGFFGLQSADLEVLEGVDLNLWFSSWEAGQPGGPV